MAAEIPEWKEIECPRDLSSVETGKLALRLFRNFAWLKN